MEMAPSDIFSRLDGIVGSFNPLIIRGEKTRETLKAIDGAEAMVKVTSKEHHGEIFIPKTKLKTPQEVFAMAQYLACDGIIIDGLYLMAPNEGKFGSKWERISEISNQIKVGAGDVNIPTLALTQIKRVGGRKELYDPEDIAYSDSIGQDADFVLVSNPSVLDKNKIELQLVKNRFGKEIATICSIDFDKMKLVEESVMTEEMTGAEWFSERSEVKEGSWIE
jgi:replicative DNA helicase